MTVWEVPPPPPLQVSQLVSQVVKRVVAPTTADSHSLPQPVARQLQALLTNLPPLPVERLAQLGPAKPSGVPARKPSDPPLPLPPPPVGEQLEVRSDRQEYDLNTQTFTATGNVVIRSAQAELRADRIIVNIANQDTQAQGNVFFRRGNQTITGAELSYNLRTQNGTLTQASGFVDLASLTDPNPPRLPADTAPGSILLNPLAGVAEGRVRRLGFTAERLVLLAGEQWVAENLRVTNDPFAPPELELLTSKATLTPLGSGTSELVLEAPTVGFDQVFFLPIPLNRLTLDQFSRPFASLVAFDQVDRGGTYFQQTFDVVSNPDFNLTVAPQILFQRVLERSGGLFDRDIIGLVAEARGNLGDTQFITARATLSGLNFSELDSVLRANLRYTRTVFDDHNLSVTYGFRERFFNGSLGFQEVSNIGGAVITSPNRQIGDTGITLNYQLGAQIINGVRADLTPNVQGTLGKFQSAVTLGRSFNIARGTPLPETKETGLRFVARPIVPSLDAFVGVSGAYALYSNGANQGIMSGTLGLSTVLGNFTRDFLDYTALSVSFTQSVVTGLSPFRFDRLSDQRSVTVQLLQQIYGPIRVGISQSWNLDTGNLFDSSYTLQYDRRTYAVIIRYNPNQGIGELLLRVSDFNWTDPPSPVTNVRGGIERQD